MEFILILLTLWRDN